MKKTKILLGFLALILIGTVGCQKNANNEIMVKNTHVNEQAASPYKQLGQNDFKERDLSVKIPSNLYVCEEDGVSQDLPLIYQMRFDEDCTVNDVWEANLIIGLNTEKEMILEDEFDKYFQKYYAVEFSENTNVPTIENNVNAPLNNSITNVKQITKNKEYLTINGQNALKVSFLKQNITAIVVLSKNKTRVAVWNIANENEKYESVINSFEFTDQAL